MLEQILQECRNWFAYKASTGTFTIAEGQLALPFMSEGQYYRIIGSVFNDGLHKHPESNLIDEVFYGTVWFLAVPQAVISLSEKVAKWEEKNGSGAAGPFTSESFGGYSYTRATGKDGGAYTWKDAFASDLNRWRKL